MGSIRDIPQTYEEADKFIGEKGERKVCNNTILYRCANLYAPQEQYYGLRASVGVIVLKLHNTSIVKWYSNGRIELNSGGWRTVITKQRMNAVISGLAYISQEKYVWFIYCPNRIIFTDGFILVDNRNESLPQLSKIGGEQY